MKRFISMVLAVLMLFSATSSLGEGFSLRNGISFGDTMEEVLGKETATIKSIDDSNDDDSTSDNDTSDEESEVEYPYSITTENLTLAGISGSYIVYKFDANKVLREVDYYFRSSSYKDTIDNDYDNVNEGLIRKYGKPLGYSGGSSYIFTGSALEGAALVAYLFAYLDGYGDLRDYDEWDVDAGDYHVKIEQVEYYYGSSYSDITYSHRMSYTYFTDEDLADELDAKWADQAAVDGDL